MSSCHAGGIYWNSRPVMTGEMRVPVVPVSMSQCPNEIEKMPRERWIDQWDVVPSVRCLGRDVEDRGHPALQSGSTGNRQPQSSSRQSAISHRLPQSETYSNTHEAHHSQYQASVNPALSSHPPGSFHGSHSETSHEFRHTQTGQVSARINDTECHDYRYREDRSYSSHRESYDTTTGQIETKTTYLRQETTLTPSSASSDWHNAGRSTASGSVASSVPSSVYSSTGWHNLSQYNPSPSVGTSLPQGHVSSGEGSRDNDYLTPVESEFYGDDQHPNYFEPGATEDSHYPVGTIYDYDDGNYDEE
ncbi:hypothetical protein GGR50DRAFT_645329 [Xylaria sp. CBS 124048]|nr:hypothetical protein GGR50DRAFT_645329 [Xylaria sp. CBS 124048]